MEKKLEWYTKMLGKVQSILLSSQPLIELVQSATKKVKELASAAMEALAAIKKYTIEKILYVERICLSSSLAMEKGICFSMDAEIYKGGKSGQKIEFKDKEVCFNLNFVKEMAKEIAKAIFPSLDRTEGKSNEIKEILKKSAKDAASIQKQAEELDKDSELKTRDLEVYIYLCYINCLYI